MDPASVQFSGPGACDPGSFPCAKKIESIFFELMVFPSKLLLHHYLTLDSKEVSPPVDLGGLLRILIHGTLVLGRADPAAH